MTKSKNFDLIKQDLLKIAIGALVAGGGAGATYFVQMASNIDYGEWTPIITALLSVLINILRKWIITTKY